MTPTSLHTIKLPTPPAIALRILEAVKKDHASFEELARIILVDPALTAKVLKVANSSFYSMPNKISTIEKALSVLGTNVTKNIALSFVIAKELSSSENPGFDFQYFWKRAVTCAVASELLAAKVRYHNEELFVSALLQDIGVLILFLSIPDQYRRVLEENKITEVPLREIEQKVLGYDHQEVGRNLLESWGLPQGIVAVVSDHHSATLPDSLKMQVDILRWSSVLASVYFGFQSVEKIQELKKELCPVFHFTAADIEELVDQVAKKSVEILSFFEIDPGAMRPFSVLLQEANEELQRINLSYEQVVMQAKQARQKAELLAAELLEANTRLRDMAFCDGLTGLYNYRYFQEILDREVSQATRYHLALSLIIFDIDFFKQVNDTYGHQAGDKVLNQLALLVKHSMRTSDVVARYGGEEFAILLPVTDKAGCKVFAERLRRQVEEMEVIVEDGVTVKITISVGLTSYDEKSEAPLQKTWFVAAADAALYNAKHSGRNRVCVMDIQGRKKRNA